MGAQDYTNSLQQMITEGGALDRIPDAQWDPQLRVLMQTQRVAAYEEALLSSRLEDLRRGHLL